MKLPALFPVVFFAGGILLSAAFLDHPAFSSRIFLLAIALLLLLGWIALRRDWILSATFFAACAWLSLGLLADRLEHQSTPQNLASTLIESGKLDSSAPLRWRGRLRGDPLELPWGKRYEIKLEEVESAAGTASVAGGLRLTYYQPESTHSEPPPVRAGDRVEVFARAIPIRNFADPGSFDYRAYLARENIQLQATLRNAELLTIMGRPRLTLSDRLARARGRLLHTVDDLLRHDRTRPRLPAPCCLGTAVLSITTASWIFRRQGSITCWSWLGCTLALSPRFSFGRDADSASAYSHGLC